MNGPTMGSVMRTEMAEQPTVIRSLLSRSGPTCLAISQALKDRPRGVVVIARGSSLNAGTYLAYAVETLAGIPVSLARPSVFTRYGAKPNYHGWLAVAMSQSGRTPEIVSASRVIADCGATLVSVTNDATSPLAELGSVHLHLGAGREDAVPATKTVTAQMVSSLIIATALVPGFLTLDVALAHLPRAIEEILSDGSKVDELGADWAKRPGLTVLGRGFGFAAAHEIALKVREVAGVLGEAWSVTAFKHGPIAGLSPEVPVLVTSMTPSLDADTTDVIEQLRMRGNPIALCAPGPEHALALPTTDVGMHSELLTPILAVVRGQQLCGAMASALGLDPDSPRGLNKVTLTN
jgi:glutamine---fructose-6-phosphate transaminase (isomerizing)